MYVVLLAIILCHKGLQSRVHLDCEFIVERLLRRREFTGDDVQLARWQIDKNLSVDHLVLAASKHDGFEDHLRKMSSRLLCVVQVNDDEPVTSSWLY